LWVPVGAALAAKLWLCSEEFAAEAERRPAAPTRTSADLISTYKTMSYFLFDGRMLTKAASNGQARRNEVTALPVNQLKRRTVGRSSFSVVC
jgi:hypothetical protein